MQVWYDIGFISSLITVRSIADVSLRFPLSTLLLFAISRGSRNEILIYAIHTQKHNTIPEFCVDYSRMRTDVVSAAGLENHQLQAAGQYRAFSPQIILNGKVALCESCDAEVTGGVVEKIWIVSWFKTLFDNRSRGLLDSAESFWKNDEVTIVNHQLWKWVEREKKEFCSKAKKCFSISNTAQFRFDLSEGSFSIVIRGRMALFIPNHDGLSQGPQGLIFYDRLHECIFV